MKRWPLFRVPMAFVLAYAFSVDAAIWHVNKSAPSGGDGLTWSTAFQTIQPAIDAAFADGGGELWIAAGVYDEARDPATGALLLREGVALYGGFAGEETQRDQRNFAANQVVVTGEFARGGLKAYNTMAGTSHALLDGLVITGVSYSGLWFPESTFVTIKNVTITAGAEDTMTGLRASGSNYSIQFCAFLGLSSGGAYIEVSDSTILDSEFIGNRSNDGGGLLAVRLGNVQIERCVFVNNWASSQGGAIFLDSAEWEYCYYEDRYPRVLNCLFVGNSSGDSGGAVMAYVFEPYHDKGQPVFGAKGGDDPVACNSCTFCSLGGYFATPIFSGCVFVNNTSANSGSAVAGTEQIPGANCIFFNNSEPAITPFNVQPDMQFLGGFVYSNLQVCDGGEGNICGDPLFVDAANGDYRLRRDSPCVDAGKNTNTEFYGMAASDFDGNPRGYDARAGSQGDGSNFDMGAFERTESRHDGDQDGDGVIGLSELLRVIQFYNSPGYHCDASSEDAFAPGPGGQDCAPHASDYAPQDWQIAISELLRLIQFYNYAGYHPCAEGEDGFCPGA